MARRSREPLSGVDESLRDRVEGIHRFIEDHKTRLGVPEVQEEFYAHGDLFEVVGSDGSIVHRAESLHEAVAAPLGTREGEGRFMNATHAGVPLRFFSQTVEVDGQPYTVHVAAALRDLEQGLHDALWLLAPLFPALLLLSCAGGYWMSRRALAPVDRITQMARTIEADNLEHRLDVPATGDELERLSHTLNEMMDRIDKAFKRTLRFTADASHELHTPLAVMRTTAEVALRSPRPADHRAALQEVTAEIERTSQVVENMLLLAKADSGRARIDKRAVDLVAAVEDACSEVRVLAQVKGVVLDVQLPEQPIRFHGDRDALRRRFVILLDNAVKYTPTGGRVETSLPEQDESATDGAIAMQQARGRAPTVS